MKTIPSTFRKHGYEFTLVTRVADVAIYEQSRSGRVFAYEVVKIRVSKASEFRGIQFPEAERLPSDQEWGTSGKTYSLSGSTQVEARNAAVAKMRGWVAESNLAPTQT